MSDPGDTIDSTDEPADTGPHELIYLAAAGEAIMEEMARDDRVVLVGEDIELYGGGQAVPRFGRERVRSAPISEGGFTGMAIEADDRNAHGLELGGSSRKRHGGRACEQQLATIPIL